MYFILICNFTVSKIICKSAFVCNVYILHIHYSDMACVNQGVGLSN